MKLWDSTTDVYTHKMAINNIFSIWPAGKLHHAHDSSTISIMNYYQLYQDFLVQQIYQDF